MPEQQILWTALPRAAGADTLELDVLVSPRLGVNAAPGTGLALSDFPDIERWTRTLADRLTFRVELGDGSRHDADTIPVAALDHAAWEHLFRPTAFVRPWTFRDLSARPIHSYSIRFVTAYLRDLYVDLGRRFPTAPPPRTQLDPFRRTVGPVTDVRVKEEREPPPPEPQDIPPPAVDVPPPAPAPQGCLAALWRLLDALIVLLRPLAVLLPARVRHAARALLRALRAASGADAPPPDPTRPKVTIPRTVHPTPYVTKPPIGPPALPPMEQLEQRMAAEKAIAPAAPQGAITTALAARDLTFDFARAKRFHERPESEVAAPSPPSKPRLDVHQALGALGDYPELMRKLGLVVRVRIPRPASDPVSVRVIPLWDGAMRTSDIAPRTRCVLDGERFAAAHGPDSDFAGGAVDLGGVSDRIATDAPRFDVVQVDSDGAAMKAIVAAATLERAHQLDALGVDSLHRPERETVPALRSGGLALVRADRAWHVHRHLVAANAQKTPKPAAVAGEPAELASELFAEDLVRGYRIDVRPDGGDWLSLCERVGTYDLVDDAGAFVRRVLDTSDHGYVKRTSATSQAGDDTPLYVQEALARWTGWSLVAQRPGLTLENHVDGPPPPGQPYDRPAEPRNDAETEFRLVTRFAAKPGSLPRLRFGHGYAMRALCVDLCGEPLTALAPSAPHTDAVVYRRFEPAGPPAPLPLRAFWPGESLERLVVRSDIDRDSATYDQQVMEAGASDATAHRTRHVVPPKTSQQLAELHGKLDAAFGPNGDPDVGYQISLRESGTFAAPKVPFGTPVDVGDYWVNTADETLPAPYLPDPMVAGAALRGLPGLVDHVTGQALPVHHVRAGDDPTKTEPLLHVPYGGTWPDVTGFRLRVAEQTAGAQPPHWDGAHRVLTVYLAKGATHVVRYSSYVVPAALQTHGLWEWLDDDDPASGLRAAAEAGAHWMITPPRTFVLVHAVQHPVEAARFTALKATRTQIGETTATFADGTLELHVPSTGRIEVIGRWTEFLDDPDDGWREEPRESSATDYTVETDDAPDAVWTSPMAFPPATPGLRNAHEFGDTRHRRVRYLVRATSRFREYLPADLPTAELVRDTAPGDEVEVSVLNSARPLPPGVLYAVPTFDWPSAQPTAGWTAHEHRRGGGGLRVYLDRPWFQSGEGELLGVLLQGTQDLPDGLRSRYGHDAIWAGGPQPAEAVPLEPRHFQDPAVVKPVRIPEDGGLEALAVGFEPVWDKQRKLWACDIALDLDTLPWSYWPFVRLAFVRFQPESVEYAMVSKVVLGDFGQVAPGRVLSLTWQGDQRIALSLRGLAPEAPFAPRLAVRVQRTAVAAGTDPDELDWEHAGGDPVVIDAPAFFHLVEPTDPDGDGNLRWDRVVDLPVDRHAARMRLEIAEYELLRADSEFGRGLPRITYAAHVPLT